jgi:RNA polymerase sigma-54 factor
MNNERMGQMQHLGQLQEQRLSQAISQQQLLQAQLVELPITQLIERINTEMNDNPALEAEPADDHDPWDTGGAVGDDAADDDFDSQREREERQSALDDALAAIGRDDEDLPVYAGGAAGAADHEEMVYGETLSFYDQLKEQMGESALTDRQRTIMEYLIGSLDDDGLLRKSLLSIADELAVYYNIDASEAELEKVLQMLQTFDPPGIGARSLQECLLLQIQRRKEEEKRRRGEKETGEPLLSEQMERVIRNYYEEFTKKRWERIQMALGVSDLQMETLIRELRRLNPKPGASMGETVGRSLQQITPDFIIDTQDDGTVTFTLNQGEMPELKVSQSFVDSMKEYMQNRDHMSRQTKEALLYIKQKVDAAQGFIDAIRVRRHTLTATMRAIIQLQHQFFVDGDEASLRPMILKDVAERTGLDLSTISRVSNSKYAQTRWGTFPLRYFFSDSYVTESGEELSTRKIKATLRDLIDAEDKQNPMNDDALTAALAARGYTIARRTVAKYREQLGIPVARLRK